MVIGLSMMLTSGDVMDSIPGLFAYWNSENVVVAGSTVTKVKDVSGNNKTARDLSTVSLDPTYTAADANFAGKPSISATSGAAKRLQATLDVSLAQPSTWYLVMRAETVGAGKVVYWRSNAGNFTDSAGLYVPDTMTMHMLTLDASNAISSTNTVTGGTNYVNCCVYNSTGVSSIYMNNSQTVWSTSPGEGSIDSNSCAVVTIGTFAGEEAAYSWTTMAAYSGVHDAATRKKVMAYLGAKYGITTT